MKTYYVYHTYKKMFVAGITATGLTWVDNAQYALNIKEESNAVALTLFIVKEYKEDNLIIKWN